MTNINLEMEEYAGDTDSKSLGFVMESISKPCEGLFHEDSESLGFITESISGPCEGLFHEDGQPRKEDRSRTGSRSQKEKKIEGTDDRYKSNVSEVVRKILHQDLILCMNGKHLFIKKDGIYVAISFSVESEIMYLKILSRRYGWKLHLSEYKAILSELKTEPDIWVESIGKKDGKYDVCFCGGRRLHGVEGEFDDYMVQGQIHTKRRPFTEGILLFVNEFCEIDTSVQVGSSELFCVYQSFIDEMPDYFKASPNQFVPFLKKEYGLLGGSTGKLRVLKGICLKEG